MNEAQEETPNPLMSDLVGRINDEFAHRRGIAAWAQELLASCEFEDPVHLKLEKLSKL